MMVELGRMKRQTIEELCKENNEVLVRGARYDWPCMGTAAG